MNFIIEDWEDPNSTSVDIHEATQGLLRIDCFVNSRTISLTEFYDSIENNIQKSISVPLYQIARWLIVNWWRLRWEPQRFTHDWRMAHEMAAVGGGNAWPPIIFSSDGEIIKVQLKGQPVPDASSIRYLQGPVSCDVLANQFENTVDKFIEDILVHLANCHHPNQRLRILWEELAGERSDPDLSQECRLQAIAGIYPGSASEEWKKEADELTALTGKHSVNEVIASLQNPTKDIGNAKDQIKFIGNSKDVVDLSWVEKVERQIGTEAPFKNEIPWQKGERLAREVRRHLSIDKGPIKKTKFNELFGNKFSFRGQSASFFDGGIRNQGKEEVHITMPFSSETGQRFYLSRLLASTFLVGHQETYLPVTPTYTAMQKSERAFAQEFLCPWEELNELTDESGISKYSIKKTAQSYMVSTRAVVSALKNKNKITHDQMLGFIEDFELEEA